MNDRFAPELTGPAAEALRSSDPRLRNACEEGIITLADDRFFVGLALLYLSVQREYPVPIVCFDAGLTDEQKAWAAENMPGCIVRPIPDTENVRLVRQKLKGTSENLTEEWLLWVCPMLIAESPFRRTLWLDSDLIVLRRLGELFQKIDHGPVFTSENHDPPNTANPPELYDRLPIERAFDREEPLINGGVSGWDLERDAELLRWYRHPVMLAASDAAIRDAIKWHDQGSLIWALQKTGNEGCVLKSFDWNLCAKYIDYRLKPYSMSDDLLDVLRHDYPTANIVHWNGFKLQEKLAARLGPEPDVLDWLRGVMPGDGFSLDSKPVGPRIKMISYIGSKSGECLIRQFLNHYTRLGVDDFLIILHGEEGDPRLDAARGALIDFGIKPVEETKVFSARRKQLRMLEILDSHCGPDDWVLTADVDEFQVYPDELPRLLKRCDHLGYRFVPGKFVDRLAADGQLPQIVPDKSLWEQFPYVASVTSQISGGWSNKVVAMKGSMRIADGGSHGLEYGVDGHRNYAATHRDSHRYPAVAEVHHFKWDASLVTRVDEKLRSIGGDLDAADGREFMHEYRRLMKHLDLHGRVKIEGARHVGEPKLHFVRK